MNSVKRILTATVITCLLLQPTRPQDPSQGGFGSLDPTVSTYGTTPIVIDWTYIYQDGKGQETDEILAKWFHYYESLGEFDNGVLSFLFAHITGGIRHVAIFEDLDAFKMHAENTVRSPYYA